MSALQRSVSHLSPGWRLWGEACGHSSSPASASGKPPPAPFSPGGSPTGRTGRWSVCPHPSWAQHQAWAEERWGAARQVEATWARQETLKEIITNFHFPFYSQKTVLIRSKSNSKTLLWTKKKKCFQVLLYLPCLFFPVMPSLICEASPTSWPLTVLLPEAWKKSFLSTLQASGPSTLSYGAPAFSLRHSPSSGPGGLRGRPCNALYVAHCTRAPHLNGWYSRGGCCMFGY